MTNTNGGSISYFYNCLTNQANRSCFTFYGEFHREWVASGVAEACTLFLVSLASLTANAFVIYGIASRRPLRSATNCLILNVAVADAALAATAPLVAVTRITETWMFGNQACHILPYLQLICGAILAWSLAAISVETYRRTVATTSKPGFTGRQVALVVTIGWAAAASLFMPLLLYFREVALLLDGQQINICTLMLPSHQTVLKSVTIVILWATLVIVAPMATITYSYHNVFKKLRAARNEVYRPVEESSTWIASDVMRAHSVPASPTDSAQSATVPRSLDDLPLPDSTGTEGVHGALNKQNSAEESCTNQASRSGTVTRNSGGVDWATKCNAEFVRCCQKQRDAKLKMALSLVVLFMWIPILITMFVLYVDSAANVADRIRSHNFIGLLLLAITNSCINAIWHLETNVDFQLHLGDSVKQEVLLAQKDPKEGEILARVSPRESRLHPTEDDKHIASCSICRMAQEHRLPSVSESSLPDKE